MPIPARHLVQHQSNLTTISLDSSISHALALMIEHDFSQLPVVDKDFKPVGIVTSDSIMRALLTLGTTITEPRVKDAFTKPLIFQEDEDLLYLLDYLLKASAVFIVDNAGKLIGIITDYDTTQYFRLRAEDIVLIEDIESTLKSHLLAAYGATEHENHDLQTAINSIATPIDDSRKKIRNAIKDFCQDKKVQYEQSELDLLVDKHFPPIKARAFNSLTLSEYIQFTQRAWNKLESVFDISKDAWSEMMDAVRSIRNKLVHFRGDVSPVERAKLRYCAEWFKTRQPAVNDSTDEPEPISPNKPTDASPSSKGELSEMFTNLFQTKSYAASQFEVETSIEKKYAPLASLLKDGLDENTNFFETSIDAIEKIINQPLPKAAREHNSWWHYFSPQTRQWLQTGWSVGGVNLNSQQVSFYRWSYIINMDVPEQIIHWCNELHCKADELQEAVTQVGTLSAEVKYYLDNKQKNQ